MTRGRGETVGFVVREEYTERDITTGAQRKRRRTVSRVFHARSAAADLCAFYRKVNPDRTYYVHEKDGMDEAEIR